MARTHVVGGRAVAARRGWDWVAAGWALFCKQPRTWLAWVAVLVAIILVLLMAHPLFGRLLLIGLGPLLMAGIACGCRELDEGRAMKFSHLFAGFGAAAGQLAALGAICAVATAVIVFGVVSASGVDLSAIGSGQNVAAMPPAQLMAVLLAMLVILGLLVPVAMAAWFAPLLVVFDGRRATGAMRESFVASLRNIMPMLVYGVVTLVLIVAATLPALLGWLVLLPVLAASVYTSYKDVFTTA
jgi:hypothetical protein